MDYSKDTMLSLHNELVSRDTCIYELRRLLESVRQGHGNAISNLIKEQEQKIMRRDYISYTERDVIACEIAKALP